MEILSLLLKFIVGGAVVAGVALITRTISPEWGGILAVAPAMTTLAIIFVFIENNTEITRELTLSSMYYIFPTLIFLASVYFTLDKFGIVGSLIASYAAWLIVVLVMQKIIII